MRVRLFAALVVLAAGVVLSARFVLEGPGNQTDAFMAPDGAAAPSTLSLAPISLGNPAAAATLNARHPDLPRREGARAAVIHHTLRAGAGDTLTGMLVKAGIDRDEAHAATAALKGYYDPRRIKPGSEVVVAIAPEDGGAGPGRLHGLLLAPSFDVRVSVARNRDGGYQTTRETLELERSLARATATINQSLFVAGTRAGVPAPVLAELIRAYSWDVDFQRDIRKGDSLEVLFERTHDAGGAVVNNGRIQYAALTLSGRRHAIYTYTARDGATGYYNEKGLSARKALMRTPIDGARLSSGFGKRRHPILGYNKMHRGLDFAAPRGTPIYAAGDGTVQYAGLNGAYGKYVRIRHNSRFSTAYAHLRRIAKSARTGRRVSQGQIIGYVGTTGRSTGPHLHYEILRAGRRVNPLRVRMPSGRKLTGAELALFQTARAEMDQRFFAAGAVSAAPLARR